MSGTKDRKNTDKAKKENIHKGHRERMRNKLKMIDSDYFEPHELLEYLLFTVIPRSNTNGIAHELLNNFNNSISEVLDAPIDELMKIKGIGKQTAIFIHSIPFMAKFYLWSKNNSKVRLTTQNLREYCKKSAEKLHDNGIFITYLNADGSVFNENIISADCINEDGLINTREVSHYFWEVDSAAVILIHKVVGDMENMNFNYNICTNIQTVTTILKLFETPLIDYIIIHNGEFISLRNSGVFDDKDYM